MKKKQIITISGRPGSGKSTASRSVASELGYEHFSSGDLFRAIAKERGFDVAEFNKHVEDEKEVDHLVDQRLRDIGTQQDQVVIDSRMAWHWMPYSFKVYLDLDLDIAAKRIIDSMDKQRLEYEHIPEDPEAYVKILADRLASESKRYKNLYNVDPYNLENYDLVIDSSANSPKEVLDLIIQKFNSWFAN